MEVLNELYKKIEDLPKNHPNLDATRKKFNELKRLYQEIAGEPQLSLNQLLKKITDHRAANNSLFNVRRSQSIFSGLVEALGFKTGTQQAYDRMTKVVIEEIKRGKEGQVIIDRREDTSQLGDSLLLQKIPSM